MKTQSQDVTKDRDLYIGGSDMAAVMGLNKYTSTLQLYLMKKGKWDVPIPEKVQERMDVGSVMEDVIADLYTQYTGNKVRRRNKPYFGPGNFSFIRGHVDRLIEGTDWILEIKNVGHYAAQDWGKPNTSEIPEYFKWQAYCYMYLSGKSRVVFAAFFEGAEIGLYYLDRDEEKIEAMLARCLRFKNLLDTNTPPPVNGHAIDSEKMALDVMHKESQKDEQIVAPPEVEDLLVALKNLKKSSTTNKKVEAEITNKIKQFMGDHKFLVSDSGSVIWKSADPVLSLKSKKDIFTLHEEGEIDTGIFEKISFMKEQPRVFKVK